MNRDTTERPEAVEAGTVKLVGTKVKQIINEARRLLNDADYYKKMAHAHNPYGDEETAEKILGILMDIKDNTGRQSFLK